jgi:hypothetical protein
VLGLPKLLRFGDLSFLDCAGLRLLLEKSHHPGPPSGTADSFRHDLPALRRHCAKRLRATGAGRVIRAGRSAAQTNALTQRTPGRRGGRGGAEPVAAVAPALRPCVKSLFFLRTQIARRWP